ncbi:hypothetical protein EYF80_061931 [Liparis tanakae]|uniref:Uncharacterized protein n=1 Tax=Liparis tanakae TaxID=230148 RepID=A0A4Z2EHU1_9TELE|nr:hypothetical protein EYF80_061931 [Liparis tanakae]
MWLVTVLVPLLRLYLAGIRVLLYQMFHRSFTLPGNALRGHGARLRGHATVTRVTLFV